MAACEDIRMDSRPIGLPSHLRGIVVVEDDPVLRMLLTEIVVESGAECHAFSTGDDAKDFLMAGHRCDALIVDHGLPGETRGADLVIMVNEFWPHVRCVLTSGYDLAELELPGNIVYLPKPWSLASLLGSLVASGGKSKEG